MPTEKLLDKEIERAIKYDATFCRWFLSRTKRGANYSRWLWSRSDHPWGKTRLLLPNAKTGALEMVARDGETDILVVFEGKGTQRLGVHIENKLAAGTFEKFQPEGYAARAAAWIGNAKYGDYQEWETVLLAPNSFYNKHLADARKFTTFIAHEDVALHSPAFKAAMLNAAEGGLP